MKCPKCKTENLFDSKCCKGCATPFPVSEEASFPHTKAIEHYEKFLDLWKDAGPGLPEVNDAKKHLTALQK